MNPKTNQINVESSSFMYRSMGVLFMIITGLLETIIRPRRDMKKVIVLVALYLMVISPMIGAAADKEIPGADFMRDIKDNSEGWLMLVIAILVIITILSMFMVFLKYKDLEKAFYVLVGGVIIIVAIVIVWDELFNIVNIFLNAKGWTI